jgi:hypothetical protein
MVFGFIRSVLAITNRITARCHISIFLQNWMEPVSSANSIPSVKEDEITTDHFKLLWLISRYSHTALTKDEKDRWIRKVQLLVLIYEGIVAKVFDYDYAPFSEVGNMIHNNWLQDNFFILQKLLTLLSFQVLGLKRVYLNISQEGRDDIDDLRELGLINGLKVSTKGYQSITAFQVSLKGIDWVRKNFKEGNIYFIGLRLLQSVPQAIKSEVDSFIYAPGTKDLLSVKWSDDKNAFFLVS